MKKMYWIGLVSAVGLGLFLLGADAVTPKPEPTRTAVCDIHKALTNYKRLIDLRDRVEKEDKEFKVEAKRRADGVEMMLKQLSDLKKDTPDYIKLDQKCWEKMYEVRSYQEVEQNRIERERRDGLQSCYEDMIVEVAGYAKDTGLDLVNYIGDVPLEAAHSIQELEQLLNSRRVLFSSPRIDITDAITTRLNAKYKSTAAETPSSETPKPEAPKTAPGK